MLTIEREKVTGSALKNNKLDQRLCRSRLMQLPSVVGVRVKIAKLEIFSDCQIAIAVETGHW